MKPVVHRYPFECHDSDSTLQLSLAKSQLQLALMEAYMKSPSQVSVVTFQCKTGSHVEVGGTTISKGELRLVPLSSSIQAGTKVPVNSLEVDMGLGGETKIYISPKTTWPNPKNPEIARFIVPYWHVNSTADQDEANMKLSYRDVDVTAKANGASAASSTTVSIPMLVNTRALKPGEELLKFVEPAVIAKPPPDLKRKAPAPKTAGAQKASKKAALKKGA